MSALKKLVENAFTGHLNGSTIGATAYAGFAGTDKPAPCVICAAKSAEEEPLGSGNYKVSIEVAIKDALGSTDFDGITEAVRDALWNDELAGALVSAESNLTAWGPSAAHRIEWDVDGDCQVERQFVEVYCAPNALT